MTNRKGAIGILLVLVLVAQALLACPLTAEAAAPVNADPASCPMHMPSGMCCKHKGASKKLPNHSAPAECALCYVQKAPQQFHSPNLIVFDQAAILPQTQTWTATADETPTPRFDYRSPPIWNLEHPPDLPRGPPCA